MVLYMSVCMYEWKRNLMASIQKQTKPKRAVLLLFLKNVLVSYEPFVVLGYNLIFFTWEEIAKKIEKNVFIRFDQSLNHNNLFYIFVHF